MKHAAALMGLMVLAGPARAADIGVQLDYAAYVAGFNVLNAQAGIELRQDRYGIGLHVRTAGALSAFVQGDTLTLVNGGFQGDGVRPEAYRSAGMWRGDPHITDIGFQAGMPVVRTLVPSNEEDRREPVPQELQRGTVDSISAIALLIRTVAETGRCDSQATTFDGRRVSQVAVRTVGMETLERTSRSSFSGPALHCEINGHQIAGFPHDAGPDDYSRRPQAGSVWMAAPAPGSAMVPVLMSFPTKLMGHMTLYLTQAQTSVNLAAFIPPKDVAPAAKAQVRQAAETPSR